MTAAQRVWILFLAGLPFAWFLFPWLDVWTAQTFFSHLSLTVLGGLLLASSSLRAPRNEPLAYWLGYCVLL